MTIPFEEGSNNLFKRYILKIKKKDAFFFFN